MTVGGARTGASSCIEVCERYPTRFQLQPFLNFNIQLCAVYAPEMKLRIEALTPQSAIPCSSLPRRAVGFQRDIRAGIGRAH